MYKKIQYVFCFFIIFLMIFSAFLMVNVESKEDTHIEYAGGVNSLLNKNNEHIVMNENGDELGVAFIGKNGDSTYVNFVYRDLPSCVWCEKPIRETTYVTYQVAITQDSDFNIHAVYSEKGEDGKHYLYYKKFDWSSKTWDIPKEQMGYNLTIAGYCASSSMDIKVSISGNVYIISGQMHIATTNSELILNRYNSVSETWDLALSIDSELIASKHIFKHESIALDSGSNIYCTYSKKQDGHWLEEYYDTWIVTSTNDGSNWSSPSQIINKTYPQTCHSGKLIISNDNVFYYTASQNWSTNDNLTSTYSKSINYGTTWSNFVNLSNVSIVSGTPSVSMDGNNVVYFLYRYYEEGENRIIRGRKLENNILGDEVIVVDNKNPLSPNLAFSNIYNQYADNGIIGIYEDRSIANFDIRFLQMDYNDFVLGQYNLRIVPDKPIYYTFDVIKIYVDNPTNRAVAIRFLNATGVKVEPMGTHSFASGTDWYTTKTIPSMYGSGTWQVQASPYDEGQAIVWGVFGTEYLNFTVQDSGLDYFISAYPSWVIRNNYVSFEFSAKAGEMYRIELWNPYPFGGGGNAIGNITTSPYGVNQTAVYQYGFLMVEDGTYLLNLYNATSGGKIAFSNSFHVGEQPEDNTYSVNIATRYKYTDRPKITITRWGSQNYEYHVYNENDIQIASGHSALSEHRFTLYMSVSDIGTGYIRVYNLGHTPSDSNAVYIEFQIYDPEGLTGDPLHDYLVGIDPFWKGIIGLFVVLLCTFMPFIAMRKLADAGVKFNIDIPPMLYTICCGVGAIITLIFQLWAIEYVFFICVMAGVGTLILYFIGQRNNG